MLVVISLPLLAAMVFSLLFQLESLGQLGLYFGGGLIALLIAWSHFRKFDKLQPTVNELLKNLSAQNYSAAAELINSSPLLSQDMLIPIEQLRDNTSRLRIRTTQRIESFGQLVEEFTQLSGMLRNQRLSLNRVSHATDNSDDSQSSTDKSIDELAHSAEESASSILEMVAINNEVRENLHKLAGSVQETTTAIEQMTFSSKEVAKNIDELSTAAEETAASMNQMDVSISHVESNAAETSKLSEQVSRDAATGVGAINTTIEGIDRIKDTSRGAAEVIGNLGERIEQIGNILNVIDDVAEQTNLLALNAAIIAAQAGEYGRGFAVVADEIKALAERTGASTKEIASLISSIQEESRNAVSVMSQGVEDVHEGVRLGHNAEDALRKIVDSAKQSTLMIQAIAQATIEQSKGSKQVTNAISRIAETVQQIALATSEQAKGTEYIMQSAERMKVITQQVELSADEQNRGGQQVTIAIENIRDMADRINHAQKKQSDINRQVSTSMAEAQSAGQRSLELSQQLELSLNNLSKEMKRDLAL